MLEHAGHAAHDAVRVLQAPLLEQVHHALPLADVAGHHPVDGLFHPPLHDLGQVGHDLLVEGALDLGRIDEVEDTAQPQRGVEELHAPALELQQHLLDVREPETEVAGEVPLIQGELAIDGLDRLEVLFQEEEPSLGYLHMLVEEVEPDAERVWKLRRDAHALHSENGAFRFEATVREGRATWQPYESLPAVTALTNGTYRHDPQWYRAFLYEEERARGYEATEDCGAPGEFTYELGSLPGATAWLVVGAELDAARRALAGRATAATLGRRVRAAANLGQLRFAAHRAARTPSARASSLELGSPCATGGVTPCEAACRQADERALARLVATSPRGCSPTSSRSRGATRNTTASTPGCGSWSR